MDFLRTLRRLLGHRHFRRLMAVRIASQSCDGVLQVALASYVLFSPERQPDARSIAAVLAITLLPFSILGPFVSVVLDRWSRRQILVIGHLGRAGLTVALALLVVGGLRIGTVETAFYGVLLLAMSLNRFLLAALAASLPHTIEPEEYLAANSVVPVVGPAGGLLGAGVALALRLLLGSRLAAYQADAVVFGVAAAGFVLSALLALRIPRRQLGPDVVQRPRAADIVAGLGAAFRHLAEHRPAALGLLTIGAHRIIYGVMTVATILVYRNYFHSPSQVDSAIADLGLFVAATGAGFVLATVVTPALTGLVGLRGCVLVSLVSSAIFQVVPGAIYAKIPLLVAAFLLGLMAQNLKICVDTLVQAHVGDAFKGRVFVLYDMVFNVALVSAAGIGALVLPATGKSVPTLVTLSGLYLVVAAGFAVLSRGLSMTEGTESLSVSPVGSPTTPATPPEPGPHRAALRRS